MRYLYERSKLAMSHMGISTNGVLHLAVACDNEAVVWAGGEGRGGTATAAACLVHSSYALALPCSKTLPKGETHCRSTWCSDTGASQRLLHEGEFHSLPQQQLSWDVPPRGAMNCWGKKVSSSSTGQCRKGARCFS